MSNILSTVEGYEGQVLEFVKNAKAPVTEFVGNAVDRVIDTLPEVNLPAVDLPTPPKFVQSQADFVKQLVEANTDLVTAVFETVAAKTSGSKAKGTTTKATRATKSTVKAA